MDNKHNMLGYLSLDIICSSKLTALLELRSRKTVRFLEQIMSADKYPSIFSRQMKAVVYTSQISNVWMPGREICIGEGMIAFRERYILKFTIQTIMTSTASNHISCVILVMATVASLRSTQVEIKIHPVLRVQPMIL